MTDEMILFVDLADGEDVLTPGKPFIGLTTGTFIGMSGRRSTVRKRALPKLVENTKKLIETTKAEDGELIGLPVDAFGHDNGDGAGWVKDVELSSDKNSILFLVDWTEIGYDLITKKIRRWFSATLSLSKNIIFGGTLTNWPAVRGPDGEYLLTPVQLSQDNPTLSQIKDDTSYSTLNDIKVISSAFYDEFGWDDYSLEDIDLPGEFVVVRTNGAYYRATFTLTDGDVVFAEETEWKKTQKVWQDYAANAKQWFRKTFSKNPNSVEEFTMNEENTAEVNALISEALQPLMDQIGSISTALTSLSTGNPGAGNGDGNPADPQQTINKDKFVESLSEIVNLKEMNTELAGAIQDVLAENYEAVQQQAKADYAQLLAETRIKSRVTELCTNLTQGTPKVPRGLPLDANELQAHLLSLNSEQRKYFEEAFSTIWQNGLVSFEELGHSQETKGTRELPEDIQADLRSGELTLDDLKSPILAPALGNLSDYNLSEFKE